MAMQCVTVFTDVTRSSGLSTVATVACWWTARRCECAGAELFSGSKEMKKCRGHMRRHTCIP
jgi:hypothetical protein